MSSGGPGRRRAHAPLWFELWIGVVTCVVAILCAALCWQVAAEGGFPAEVLLWVGLTVVGVVALLSGLFGLMRYHAVMISVVSPLLIAVLAALLWFEVPQTAGWRLSRPILEDQAVECANPGHRTRLGMYTVTYVTRRDGGCLFYTEGGETNSGGFAFFPDSAPSVGPAPLGGIEYRPFRDRWYRFAENN